MALLVQVSGDFWFRLYRNHGSGFANFAFQVLFEFRSSFWKIACSGLGRSLVQDLGSHLGQVFVDFEFFASATYVAESSMKVMNLNAGDRSLPGNRLARGPHPDRQKFITSKTPILPKGPCRVNFKAAASGRVHWQQFSAFFTFPKGCAATRAG